ncbi:MAG TPA: TIM barrel protein [Planctomycetota bacterium]|nr:TIM barrel protein [Planctomycetota bacterium]
MARLRQSAAEWCFFQKQHRPETYYRRLAEIGFAGVEMVDPARWEAARGAGLELVNLSGPGMTDGFNRLERHAALLPEVRAAIARAAAGGVGQVIVFSGNRGALGLEEGRKNCVRALKELARTAEQARVTLAFEMLNSQDHPDYQADSAAYGFDVVRAVSSPRMRVLYDVYHMQVMGQDLLGTLLPNLELVSHIHVAGNPGRAFPGPDQEIDYRRLVAAVHAAGYRGCWGHEFLPARDSLEELEAAFRLFESCV